MHPMHTDIHDLIDHLIESRAEELESYDGFTPSMVRSYGQFQFHFEFAGGIYPIDVWTNIYPQIFAVVDAHNKSL